jgi:hypothetical protein
MFFGIIEFAFILSAIGGYNFASREGARLGSIFGQNDPQADKDILNIILSRSTSFPFSKAVTIDIYRATSDGQCLTKTALQEPPPASTTSVGAANCIEDQYAITGSTYAATISTWPVSSRDDTLNNADYLGVRVLYQYTYVTGFIGGAGAGLNLSATSVQRIEPQDYGSSADIQAPSVMALARIWPSLTATLPAQHPFSAGREGGVQ